MRHNDQAHRTVGPRFWVGVLWAIALEAGALLLMVGAACAVVLALHGALNGATGS